ncbi:hypothetical protein ACSBQT_10865 [Brevibacterium sp. H602]|uniref:hypothetical protein n=1 Tax=Brevibacterium sp. H602 TaxID=3444316 RepID=UPI003EBD531E
MLAVAIIALGVSGISAAFAIWAAWSTAKQAKESAAQTAIQKQQTRIQRKQVATAEQQTRLQRQIARDSMQPYVWADLQPDMQRGSTVDLVVGNSGPTVAHNVKVSIDPPLPGNAQNSDKIASVQQQLADGLRSISPGRVIRWNVGPGHELMSEDAPQVRQIRIEGEGPSGPLPPLELQIDLNQLRQSKDAPDGSLHHVRSSIKDLTKAVDKIQNTIRKNQRDD